jgi:preprotein translocase subunit YajC
MKHFLLQAAAGGQPQASPWGSILMMVAFVGIFYFFMIRPQMKKAKEQKKFQEGLQVGDKIVTLGGIHGKVVEVGDTDLVITLDQGRMRIEKAAVSADRTVREEAK